VNRRIEPGPEERIELGESRPVQLSELFGVQKDRFLDAIVRVEHDRDCGGTQPHHVVLESVAVGLLQIYDVKRLS
jgi:hypothetical protein